MNQPGSARAKVTYRVRRYFTPTEASRMIPFLEESFQKVFALKGDIGNVLQELRALGVDPTADEFDIETVEDDRARNLAERLQDLVGNANDEIARIQDTGVVVKDIDTGLCDFFTKRGARDVYLCWRVGEKEVGYWHDLETGFRGRQTIDGAEQFSGSALN